MEHSAGIDVSLESSSVCVVDATGRRVLQHHLHRAFPTFRRISIGSLLRHCPTFSSVEPPAKPGAGQRRCGGWLHVVELDFSSRRTTRSRNRSTASFRLSA
jgi:hypothetical protein